MGHSQNSGKRSSVSSLSFVSPLGLELFGQIVVAGLEVIELSFEILIFRHQSVHVGITWSAHGFLDIIVHISWLFRLLVESNKDLG